MRSARRSLIAAACTAPLLLGAGTAVAATPGHHGGPTISQANLVSDLPGRAQLTDPSLVNPWGLTFGPTTPIWAANNGADNSTLYSDGASGVAKVPLTVSITDGAPTGTVFNDTTDFVVNGVGPARFIFASEAGSITAWNPDAAATTAVREAHVPGAIFKGLALLHTKFGPFLLAADFHHGRIDVFDSNFHRVKLPRAFFHDPRLPKGYAPFDVAVLNNSIYVSYAKQDADAEDEVDHPGFGFVDRYSSFGLHPHRIASRGTLNAPWGMAIAPTSFGRFAGDLLVGNFGDGHINVFDPNSGRFHGLLRGTNGRPIRIPGLWALLPGTATTGGTDAVWFSAGIDNEAHGLLGLLRPAS
jgi:uncharacterized protein (TIGR03118 family)